MRSAIGDKTFEYSCGLPAKAFQGRLKGFVGEKTHFDHNLCLLLAFVTFATQPLFDTTFIRLNLHILAPVDDVLRGS